MKCISVIIPVYNVEKHLNKCLDSVLNQTVNIFEIILVDDGSTDSSGEICDKYASQHKNIKVIHKSNKGVSAARNDGLKIATGELISFIDADDQLEDDMYELLVGLICNYQADIAHCGYKRMAEDETVLNECFGTHRIVEQKSEQAIENMLSGQLFNCGLWNKLYRKSIIGNIRFDNELKNNEDVLFNFQVFQKAKKIVFADETKYLYYEHSSSACNTLDRIKQDKDSIKASALMIIRNNNESIMPLLSFRYYESNMQLYRYLLFSSLDTDELGLLKKETQKAFRADFKKSFKTRINHFLIVKIPIIYKIIYKLYDRKRKPKWDVVSD